MIKLFLILILCSVLHSYDWPFFNRTTQHPVTGTLGEYRSTPFVHFHKGIDIGEPKDTDVYHVIATKAVVTDVGNNWIEIGMYRYVHITTDLKREEEITAETSIGKIDSDNHLHFEEQFGAVNPLRIGGLTPYVDNTSPVIENVDFWKQGTSEQLAGALHGHIDIRVDAYDPRTSATGGHAGGNCGIYKLIIEFWKKGQLIGDRIEYHTYDRIPNSPIGYVYASGSTNTNFLYWATNDPFNVPYNKYWNSKQREGSDYTVDARFNAEALYREGQLLIRVIALDIKGNSTSYDIGNQW